MHDPTAVAAVQAGQAVFIYIIGANEEKASAFLSPPCDSGQSRSRPSQTRELMMPPADRTREQNEQDPGRVAHTRRKPCPVTF